MKKPASRDGRQKKLARILAQQAQQLAQSKGHLATRLNNLSTGHKIVIMQRLHEADLTGDLLAKEGYELLCLPAEFEPGSRCTTSMRSDPWQQSGELLWPERVSHANLDSIKVSLGSYRYAAQYQQRPSPAEGGLFKRHWFRFWRPLHMELPPVQVRMADGTVQSIEAVSLPARFDQVGQSWDLAFKDLTTSDYGVGQVWAAIGADRFLLDQRREQMDMPRAVEAIRAMSEKWPDAAAGQELRAQHSDAGGDLNRRKPVNCCPAATERCGGCTQEQPR